MGLIKIISEKKPLFVNWNQWNLSGMNDSVWAIQIFVDRLSGDITEDMRKIEELRSIPNLESIMISSQDIRDAYYFDSALRILPCKKEFVLLNDYEMKDRSNVDFKNTNYSNVYVPFDYIMYIPGNEKINGYTCTENIREEGRFFGANASLNLNFTVRADVYKILDEILGNLPVDKLDDIDKSVLVSNWLQKRMQFVEGKVSHAAGKKYICDVFKGRDKDASDIETAIKEKHGICAAFARLSCALLNNPRMNCKCNMVYSKEGGHDYFVQETDGKLYVVDNTWNITRNSDRFEGALKAKSFSYEYLLVGEDKMNENPKTRKAHTPYGFLSYRIESTGIPRERIEASVEKLKSMGVSFGDYDSPVLKQYEERIEIDDFKRE